jgi:hypothetical protein
MKKIWTFRRKNYEMESKGRGQYVLNGYHTTDSVIWDYVDDDEQPRLMGKVRRDAERFIRMNERRY